MKKLTIAALVVVSFLSGCVVYPGGGYRDHGYRQDRGEVDHDHGPVR